MYRKLLVPIDGTEFSRRAIDGSIALARQLGAGITAFIAEPPPPLPAVGRPATVMAQEIDQHDERVARHAQAVLDRFAAEAQRAGVPFSGHHRQSDSIDDAIARMAEEQGCDMIVMATHGRGAFGELMFGSHTKRVMARTKLPLVVLH